MFRGFTHICRLSAVCRYEIRDIMPPRGIVQAMELQVTHTHTHTHTLTKRIAVRNMAVVATV